MEHALTRRLATREDQKSRLFVPNRQITYLITMRLGRANDFRENILSSNIDCIESMMITTTFINPD